MRTLLWAFLLSLSSLVAYGGAPLPVQQPPSDEFGQVISTTLLTRTMNSTAQARKVEMVVYDSGVVSFVIGADVPDHPQAVDFKFDEIEQTYTATEVPIPDEDMAIFNRLSTHMRPSPRGGSGKGGSRRDIDGGPPGDCKEQCDGEASVVAHTKDPVQIILTSSTHLSNWDVYTPPPQYNCHWESYGFHACVAETNPITQWFKNSQTQTFPNGNYKVVNHNSYCDYYNYNWMLPNLSTWTSHGISVTRAPGNPTTNLTLTFNRWGEDASLLGFSYSTAGSYNTCE